MQLLIHPLIVRVDNPAGLLIRVDRQTQLESDNNAGQVQTLHRLNSDPLSR